MIVSDFAIGAVFGAIVSAVLFYARGSQVFREGMIKSYELGIRHGKEQSAWRAFILANQLTEEPSDAAHNG